MLAFGILPGRPERIHWISENGTLLSSLHGSPDMPEKGFPLWDPDGSRMVFVAADRYRVSMFDSKGFLLQEKSHEGATFQPSSGSEPGDAIRSACRQADGRIVVQVIRRTMVRPRTHREEHRLDVLDKEATLLGSASFSGDLGGLLQGCDASGAVYLQRISTAPETGTNLFKALLVPQQ